jgi:hypothetical protein
LKCAEPTRYQGSLSAPPLRIPDDLNVPDETGALRIPDEIEQIDDPEDLSCLESPPDFFEGQRQSG